MKLFNKIKREIEKFNGYAYNTVDASLTSIEGQKVTLAVTSRNPFYALFWDEPTQTIGISLKAPQETDTASVRNFLSESLYVLFAVEKINDLISKYNILIDR